MKLYRNLGAIEFQSQTSSLEIFTTSNSTTIFQLKPPETSIHILDQISNIYNHHYHLNNFSTYTEPHKESALLISNSKKTELKGIDTALLCTLILQATKIIQKISNSILSMVGQCSPNQFRVCSEKIIFVWIPLTKVEEEKKREEIIVKSIMQLLRQVLNQKDVSQKLLFKKLQKSKNLQNIIEEIGYFTSVYCIGRTKFNQHRPTLKNPSKHFSSKANRKTHLFKLDLPKNRKLLQNSQQFSFSQQRHSSIGLQISMPFPRKNYNSEHSSTQQRPSLTSKSWGKNSGIRERKGSLSRSTMKQSKISQDKSLNESSKKLKEAIGTPVNSLDEQKLIKKLLSKKKRQTESQKNTEIKGVEAIVINDLQQSSKNENEIAIIKELTKDSTIARDCHTIQQKRELNISKMQTPKKELIEKLPLKENITTSLKEENEPKQNSHQNEKKQGSKQLKKKKYIQNESLSDEIEVITLENFLKGKQLNEEEKKIDKFNSTLQNSWNKEKKITTNEQETKRSNKKHDLSEKLVQKCKDLNLMGTAVANTTQHLKKYQKIFWELPLFFIYRGFYLRRERIGQQGQKLQDKSAQLEEIIEENKKIKESINKLIKAIIKKIKKVDVKLLGTLQPYLNLDPTINCDQIMKSFIKQYIQSLTQAVEKDQQLTMHLIQITDAFLIEKGETINENQRKTAENNDNLGEYIIHQRKLLSKYL